jgi:hypothetical protein
MQRRTLIQGAAATLALPLALSAARAQSAWPTGPVRIIVGFPPGGGTDAMARVAVHLVMPAASAQDEVVSLSQTVRLEIASLGDGIERGIFGVVPEEVHEFIGFHGG